MFVGCVYGFRDDHCVVDNQSGDSSLGEADSLSLNSRWLPVV